MLTRVHAIHAIQAIHAVHAVHAVHATGIHGPRGGRSRPAAVLLLALVCCLGLPGCRQATPAEQVEVPSEPTPAPAEPSALQAKFPSLHPDVEFVGRESCEGCHFEVRGTYAETGMGRSFYPMTPDEVVEDFHDRNLFVDEVTGLHYRMTERDGKYYQRQYLLDSQGNEIAADEYEMVLVIGSNNHNRSYVLLRGDRMFQAPICWYPQATKWDYCPGYEHANDHFAREVRQGCMHCHNGRMLNVEGERNVYEKPYPHGIGCERCHGPGQLHVERWNSGTWKPTGREDETIIDPRELPQPQRMEVCFECHLGDAKASERVGRHDRSVMQARAGLAVTEVIIPFRFKEYTIQEFGLSAQADRMLLSTCFKESGGELECLTCHNPHVTVYHEDRPLDLYRRRCLGCHELEACAAPQARREATEPLADDCVACHMRKAEPDDQRHTEFTDHWIRRVIHDGPPVPRTNFEIEPVFPERLAAMPAGEQAYYWARAHFLMTPTVPQQGQDAMWDRAEARFLEAIELGFDNVESWFFLGKTRLRKGDDDGALAAFERAVQHDPTHHDAVYALGQELLERQVLQRAHDLFAGMLQRDPGDPMALAEMGRTLMALGRRDEALASYDRAIEQQPWSASLHMNRSKVLGAMGRFEEALGAIETATRLDPDSAAVWLVYSKVMEANGRLQEAEEAMQRSTRFRRLKREVGHGPEGAAMSMGG